MAFPGTYDFDYYRGDTFVFTITPKTSTGATFALDSYATAPATVIFTISPARGSSTGAINSTTNTGSLSAEVNTTTDIITCTIKPDARTVLVGGSTYYYDVEIYNGAALRYTLLTGEITVTNDVTGAS
jgi:hypothetical protein